MLTTDKKKKYTVEDYLMLEEGAPFQLINYDLIMSPSPIPAHQQLSAKIIQLLSNFLDSINDNGFLVSAPMDVKFDDGNVLQPDILYIKEGRVADLVKDRIEGAPDLIIEILSPSTAYYDLRQKKDVYEKYGVAEYIIIDPVQENADMYKLTHEGYSLEQKALKTENLTSIVIPGFKLELSKLFK
ncbi:MULTISPECIES: Uma2 family endonuclease [Mucilaginibacter]|uniref:Uma2 family endonuclease n=1 Tax=Mucilaginibacter TaxID=423349 RepID=UPI001667FAF2|nr:Uma2 family endonuclease [Mucilaginibacter rubeus]GGB16209.1 restriction endonuclease [Mucilaginibacter rubeus]